MRIINKVCFGLLTLIFLFSFIVSTTPVLASAQKIFNDGLNKTAVGDGDKKPGAGYSVTENNDPVEMIGKLIGVFLLIVGVLFLLLFIYAGFKWMSSQGNDTEITKAKDTLRNAIIGVVVVLLAYAVTAGLTVLWNGVVGT